MTPPILEIRSLKHAYGNRPVLSIDHLTIKPASIVGLIGPNGCGKSTLLRLLGLIEKPLQGKILFSGNAVEPFSDKARFLISLLPQEPLLMKRSVMKNISYGLRLRGHSGRVASRVNESLAMVGLSSKSFAKRPWYALSGGEMQRVALAARLALNPKVLLLDEPTANVDTKSAQLIRDASLNIREKSGTTLLIASHDAKWLNEVCDETWRLSKGKIFEKGHANIIVGPWSELSPGIWGKKLPGSQYIKTFKPPTDDAAAIINHFWIDPGDKKGDIDVFQLNGIVSRLSLKKNTNQIIATVTAGNLCFTINLTPQKIQARTLFPGEKIILFYHPAQIRWM